MKNLKDIKIDIAQGKSPCYVYFLFFSNGIPFYVGKGIKDRISDHEAEARYFKNGKIWKGINKLKLNTINEIIESGDQVYYEIDSWHETSMQAGEKEIELIQSIGRLILGTGPLTNIRDGGDLLTEQDRKIVGDKIRQFYIDHPEVRKRISDKLKTFCEDHPEFIESLQKEKNRWIDENNEEYLEAERKRIAICRTESHRNKISEINKKYLAENPDELERLKKQGREHWINNPEARENNRQKSIDNKSHEHILKWLADDSEETILQKQEKYKKHAEWLTEWHQTEEGKEKTKQAAEKRNEKVRTEEHRKHMSEKTKEFVKNNKEADLKRRELVSITKEKTMQIKQQCLRILELHLIKNGKIKDNKRNISHNVLYEWRKSNLIPEFFPKYGGLPVWEKCLEDILKFTKDELEVEC
ncbi:MAG: hypothetical protein EKK64_00595 [Neisseriaceae bacterium]|nr:MAG: hypothetical protein EKK64_00595 [Neisseriaceae bacterium]